MPPHSLPALTFLRLTANWISSEMANDFMFHVCNNRLVGLESFVETFLRHGCGMGGGAIGGRVNTS